MKLTKLQLKKLIKEELTTLQESDDLTWGDARLPTPELPPEFDDIEFSEIVSDAVDKIGSRKVLEIVNGVIRRL
jgi:hypothetical protein